MIKYTYKLNEEIARWSTEIYTKQHPELGWWIAFTNPTAGPWKKITVPQNGIDVEVYRFSREEERPDLVLVNDILKLILIVEAKDYLVKLVTPTQMKKSIRVIDDISKVLLNLKDDNWGDRTKYKILPSFLWMCSKEDEILKEDNIVQKSFVEHNRIGIGNDIINIVVYKDDDDNLYNSFVYKNKKYSELNNPFLK